MTTAQTAAEPLTKDDLVERTRALLPAIAERAAAAEEARRLPDATIDDFIESGFFRVMVPKRYNGLELDVSAVTDVGRLLGRVCASSGWVIPWLGWHNRGLSMFPQSVQDEVFARGFGLTAGSTTLTGEATQQHNPGTADLLREKQTQTRLLAVIAGLLALVAALLIMLL